MVHNGNKMKCEETKRLKNATKMVSIQDVTEEKLFSPWVLSFSVQLLGRTKSMIVQMEHIHMYPRTAPHMQKLKTSSLSASYTPGPKIGSKTLRLSRNA